MLYLREALERLTAESQTRNDDPLRYFLAPREPIIDNSEEVEPEVADLRRAYDEQSEHDKERYLQTGGPSDLTRASAFLNIRNDLLKHIRERRLDGLFVIQGQEWNYPGQPLNDPIGELLYRLRSSRIRTFTFTMREEGGNCASIRGL